MKLDKVAPVASPEIKIGRRRTATPHFHIDHQDPQGLSCSFRNTLLILLDPPSFLQNPRSSWQDKLHHFSRGIEVRLPFAKLRQYFYPVEGC